MILAIVGSTSLTGDNARALVADAIDRHKPTAIVSGGAVGIDTLAREEGEAAGLLVIEHLPRVMNWVDGFKPRNLLIAMECDALVRIVAKDAKTYGSGWTRDRVGDMGKPTEEHII